MIFLGEILKDEKTIGDYIIEPNDMIIVESTFEDNLQKFKSLPRAFQCNKTVNSPGFFDTIKSFFRLPKFSTLGRLESGVIGFPDVGGIGFPAMKEHLEDWRIAKAGLCLEGKCENSECLAFNEMVIMNMGVPYIHHVGMIFNKKETKCPQCESYVKAITCSFNNCKWRYSGILVTKDGPVRVRSDWKIVENEYYKFSDDENSKVDWYSLTIETNLPDNHIKINNELTQDICAICYDVFHDVAKKLKCNHIFHINCFEQLVKNNGINTRCPLCRGIVD
ncbi:unnamed protein product [Brachionus calyciflorus]|uniref:RING-type domain-containing protein n=1 Tax=Brachionus calyciflorus TaxID=104777 RepID=A0A814KIK5_9BILA|nr:unnamed protein product [Brachionus calyciflorus]